MTAGSDKSSAADAAAAVAWTRLALRLGVLCAWTALLALAWGLGRALARGARPARLRERVVRAWGRACLRAVGARVEVHGAPPPAPALLVSNHVSYLDVPVYAAACGATFIAASELRAWPVVGRLARAAGTVFLDRRDKRALLGVNREIERVLAAGGVLVFFPEGTSSSGAAVQPFRPSLLEPAARGGIPVHYAAVSYRTRPPAAPAARSVAWFDGEPFLTHALRLARGRGVDVALSFGPAPLCGQDRKVLGEGLRAAVAGLFVPLE